MPTDKRISPVVSILVPMKNAEKYIQETIQSLLNQSLLDFEIIVINDGSNDNSQALVESFNDKRIKVFQGQSKGISAALNLALSFAQGRYVCRCDADDLYPVDRLKTQVSWLETHANCIAVAGKFSSMDEASQVVAEFNTGGDACDLTTELLAGITRTTLCAFLMKREVVTQLKGFREYFVTAEDIDMQLRLAEVGRVGRVGRVGYMPENMYFYRIHDNSITHVQSSSKRIFYENTAREFLKQRLKGGLDQLEKGEPPTPPSIDDTPSNSNVQIVGYLLGESWVLHGKGYKNKAINVSVRACMKMPMNWRVWKNLMMIVLK